MKLWLDLELREDIDDYVTLLYALENNFNVDVISIHNPSVSELDLLKATLIRYKLTTPIVITGELLESYPKGKDLNSYFDNFKLGGDYDYVYYLSEFTLNYDISGVTVFCGGSLKTLSILTETFDVSTFNACVQGGFASYKVVGENITLPKFRNRERVPTWNLNLDLKATDAALGSGLEISFVSKNICHSSFVTLMDVKDSDNAVCRFLTGYFKQSRYKDKCLHDVLAFMSIETDIVEFKNVSLHKNQDDRPKWWSQLKEESNHKISVDYDYDKFLSKVTG